MLWWRGGADCIISRNNKVSEVLDNPLKTKPDICSGGEVYQIALIKLCTVKQYRASEGLENPLKTKPDVCSGGGVEQIALAAKTKGPRRA